MNIRIATLIPMLLLSVAGFSQTKWQQGWAAGVGGRLEKLSERDVLAPGFGIDVTKKHNSHWETGIAFSYATRSNEYNDLRTWSAHATALYTVLPGKHNQLKFGGGPGYRYLTNNYLSQWTETGRGEKINAVYEYAQYNAIGLGLVLEDEVSISRRLYAKVNASYQHYTRGVSNRYISLGMGYKF